MENLVSELVLELGSNVKSIKYNTDKKIWIIKYKHGLSPDYVNSQILIEFLRNV